MFETPSSYGTPRQAMKAVARELAVIANMLDCLSERTPGPCDRAILNFLGERLGDCLCDLDEAAGHFSH